MENGKVGKNPSVNLHLGKKKEIRRLVAEWKERNSAFSRMTFCEKRKRPRAPKAKGPFHGSRSGTGLESRNSAQERKDVDCKIVNLFGSIIRQRQHEISICSSRVGVIKPFYFIQMLAAGDRVIQSRSESKIW